MVFTREKRAEGAKKWGFRGIYGGVYMGVLEDRGIYGRGIYGVWLGVYRIMQIGVYMVGVYMVFLEGYIWSAEGYI